MTERPGVQSLLCPILFHEKLPFLKVRHWGTYLKVLAALPSVLPSLNQQGEGDSSLFFSEGSCSFITIHKDFANLKKLHNNNGPRAEHLVTFPPPVRLRRCCW